MTPKEKADDLFRKMYQTHSVSPSDITKYFAKQCALVAVKEIRYTHYDSITTMWWDDVEREIEKL